MKNIVNILKKITDSINDLRFRGELKAALKVPFFR